MSDTTPEPAEKPEPARAEAPREESLAPATAPAASAAAEASAAPAPTAAPPASEPDDTDPDVTEPPSSPVSARGHVNRPAGEEAVEAAPPAPAAPREPAPAIEPEPVTASEDDVAAAVARSSGEPGATAGGSATVDTATPVEAATPVIVAAEAARRQEAPDQAAPAAPAAEPVAAPSAAPAAGSVVGTATGAGAAAAGAAAAQPVTPIYLQHPHPPKKKSNRGIGILIALVGTVVFALLWTLAVVLIGALLTPSNEFVQALVEFYTGGPGFGIRGWAPVLAFFIGMVVLIQILNRSRWWAYILGGLFVAVFVYFVYVGASLVAAQVGTRNPEEVAVLLRTAWLNPFAVLAGVIAREISMWTGAWLAARGRKLKARNAEAQADYEQQVVDAQNRAANAYAGGAGY